MLRATSRAPLSHGCISKGAFPLKMSLRVDTQRLKVVGSFKESWICSNLQPSGPGHFFLGAARIVFSNIASSRVIGVSVLLKNSLGIGVSGVGCFASSFVIVACVSSAIPLLVSVLAAEENSPAEISSRALRVV